MNRVGRGVMAGKQKRAYGRHNDAAKYTKRYTEEQKIAAVTALKSCGGINKAGIAAASQIVGAELGTGTLGRWMAEYGDRVTVAMQEQPSADLPAIVDSTRGEVLQNISIGIRLLSKRFTSAEDINTLPIDKVALPLAILIDKAKTIIGIDPEVDALWRDFEQACIEHGHEAKIFFKDIINGLKMTPIGNNTARPDGSPSLEIDIRTDGR